MPGRRADLRRVAVALSLAFVVHDLEEVVMADWWRRAGPHILRERVPLAERRVELLTATTTPQMALATSVVGLGVGAVASSAFCGRERPVRAAVAVFTVHGIGHLASSALARSYTPGAATAAVVVVPWGARTWRRLGGQQGTARRRVLLDRAVTGAGALGLAVAGHALGRRLIRLDDASTRPPG